MTLRFTAAMLIVIACSPVIDAFSGHEHTDVGNDALAMALAYVRNNPTYRCSETRTKRCVDDAGMAFLEELLPGRGKISYGQMVAAVDHVVNPIKFMEREGEISCYPGDADQLYARHVLGKSQLTAWRASHVNEMHFQGEALASLWVWHFAAIKAGAAGECLTRANKEGQTIYTIVGALVLNAISEHFLQDLMAPGHVFTFRDTMGDYTALANHDRYNTMGALFLVDREGWRDELKPLLTDEGIAAQKHLDADKVAAAVAGIEYDHVIDLWGDSDLFRNDEQRLFMILMATRSILDVIDAYVTGVHDNHFDSYTWKQMEIRDGHLELPVARIPYGEYAPHRRKKRYLPQGWVVHLGLAGQGFVEGSGESAFSGVTDIELSTGYFAPGRKTASGKLEPRIYSWDFALGYSWLKGSEHDAHGPSGRFIVAIPSVDMRFSADLAYREVEGLGIRSDELAYGLRWEMGFALAAMHLALGSDAFVTSDGLLERSPTVRYGVTFSLPTTRIPGVAKVSKAWMRSKRKKFLAGFSVPPDH